MTPVRYSLEYDRAVRPCVSPGGRPGTVALYNTLLRRHSEARGLGIYNCRSVRNSTAVSKHANSEALDIDPGVDGSPLGTAIAEALVAAAAQLGIQYVIWNGKQWRPGNPLPHHLWPRYRGPAGNHADHIHIELTREAAKTLTIAAVMAAYGLSRHAARKDPDVANPTDVVDSLRVPGNPKKGPCFLLLERQGGIRVDGWLRPGLLDRGSLLSKGMLKERRDKAFTGVCVSIVPLGHLNNDGLTEQCEYRIYDSAGHPFDFTVAKAVTLRAAEKR